MKVYSAFSDFRDAWAPRLQQALGSNLLCAFAHGECQMPGFDPRTQPWQISFWLRDNQPTELARLKSLAEDPTRSGVRFGFFLTPELFANSADVFPLEYTHMANRHAVLCGESPFSDFVPQRAALRLELEREWRGLLIHMRREFLYALANPRRFQVYFAQVRQHAMPLLYGSAYLFEKIYPENHARASAILDSYVPGLEKTLSVENESVSLPESAAISLANNYILILQNLVQSIDQLEIIP